MADMEQSPKRQIIIELDQELAEEMFESLQEFGELAPEEGLVLSELLRKGLGRPEPEYLSAKLSTWERLCYLACCVLVGMFSVSVAGMFWSSGSLASELEHVVQWICVGVGLLGIVGAVVSMVKEKLLAGLKASAILAATAGVSWLVITTLFTACGRP